jgi:Domain of unknown function (DUF4202)
MTAFERAVAAFDRAHADDPRELAGENWSHRYHRRLLAWVERLAASPSEALSLAARCQHLRRWQRPRADYPAGRAGYKRWRADLAEFHAREAESILHQAGVCDDVTRRVRQLLLKQHLASDPEVQLFEDAICLTFVENELEDFATKVDSAKLARILDKTLAKMSDRGRSVAGELVAELPASAKALFTRDQAENEG